MSDFIKAVPSYCLAQADKTAAGGSSWPPEAWIVIGAWTVVLTLIAVGVYQRDTSRA